MSRFLLPLGIFAVLVAFLGVGLTLDPREVPSPLIDKDAPAFSLPALSDETKLITRDDLTRDVTLFNVWASWCVSCRVEHPLLVELAREGRVAIYGLNYKDQPADAKRWLAEWGDPYIDSAVDAAGQVGIDWGVYGVPETFVVDRKGRVRYKHIGPLSRDALQQTILPLIEKLRAEAV